ncbi:MAG: hypothetical protein JWN98_2295 [Abditibacteriota bacterium]|nr:hypothetical protein [Abditibacteriota bacterium]
MSDNIPENVSTSTTGAPPSKPTQSVSRLALLASFVAGAFAAWIFIEAADSHQLPAPPPVATSIQR